MVDLIITICTVEEIQSHVWIWVAQTVMGKQIVMGQFPYMTEMFFLFSLKCEVP